jgi:hypothetical protein
VGSGGDQAVLWIADTGMQSVQSILAADGVDLTGWVLQSVTGISANGKVIVGSGRYRDGFPEAWVADLPGGANPPTTIIRGNDDNISVFADNTNGYTIIIGNGSNDFVSADHSSFDKITSATVPMTR